MMNIYLHELKAKWRSVLVWTLSISLLMMVFLAFFETFASETALIAGMMDKLPRELLIAFNMADTDFTAILGFFAMLFTFVQICLAIQAANYGFGLVSVEETEWTADFLLSKPVRRTGILSAKLLAALTALVVTETVIWTLAFVFLDIFKGAQDFETKPAALLLLSMAALQLFFLATGLVISLLVKRVRGVLPFSMGLVFGMYILNAFGGMIGERSLEVVSPFQHFAPGYIVRNAAWDWSLAWISLVVIAACVPLSYLLYARRNIPSAV